MSMSEAYCRGAAGIFSKVGKEGGERGQAPSDSRKKRGVA